MPRRAGVRRLPQVIPEPFTRPDAVWRALGAPLDLWDVEAAAAAELAAHDPVISPELGGGPRLFYARRYWRRQRPPFLAERNALTQLEAAMPAARSRRDPGGRPGAAGGLFSELARAGPVGTRRPQ